MSRLGDLFTGNVRREMKFRVDEVLKGVDRWCRSADRLSAALEELAKKPGSTDSKSLRTLSSRTRGLEKTVESLKGFLERNQDKLM